MFAFTMTSQFIIRPNPTSASSQPSPCGTAPNAPPPPPPSNVVGQAMILLSRGRAGAATGAASRSTKRSTHARPGMHLQQCSAVPLIRWFHKHLSVCTGCTDVCHVTLLSGRVLSAITSSLHVTILGFEVYRRLDRLAVCWLSIGQPVMSSHSTLGGGQVRVCVRLILIHLTTQAVALMWL